MSDKMYYVTRVAELEQAMFEFLLATMEEGRDYKATKDDKTSFYFRREKDNIFYRKVNRSYDIDLLSTDNETLITAVKYILNQIDFTT